MSLRPALFLAFGVFALALIASCQSTSSSKRGRLPDLSAQNLSSAQLQSTLLRTLSITEAMIIEPINERILTEEIINRHKGNKLLPQDLLNEEIQRTVKFLAQDRFCLRAHASLDELQSLMNQVSFYALSLEDLHGVLVLPSKGTNILCTRSRLSWNHGVAVVAMHKESQNLEILEWHLGHSLSRDQRNLVVRRIESLPEESPESLDQIQLSQEQERTLRNALSTHSKKYVDHVLSAPSEGLSPGDRLQIQKIFYQYAEAAGVACSSDLARSLILKGASVDGLEQRIPISKEAPRSQALNCPMFAEFLYIWSPPHRDLVLHQVNELFTTVLQPSKGIPQKQILEVAKLYKLLLERLITSCQSGEQSQCVFAEFFYQNFKKASLELSRLKETELREQKRELMDLFRELTERNSQPPQKRDPPSPGLAI